MKNLKVLLAFLVLLGTSKSVGQNSSEVIQNQITYEDFMELLIQDNLSYAAERYKIPLAQMQVRASRILADPELSAKWIDNGENQITNGYGFEAELEWEVSLGAKRRARTTLAKHELTQIEYEVKGFFENLRTQATLGFAEVIKNQLILDLQFESYQHMLAIATTDSIRFEKGQISKVASLQSNLEAQFMKMQYQEAQLQYHDSVEALNLLLGDSHAHFKYYPKGSLDKSDRMFQIKDLLEQGPLLRSEYLAIKEQQAVALAELQVSKKERALDLGLRLGVQSDTFFQHVMIPKPGKTLLTVGIQVPLKFSNSKNATLKQAELNSDVAQLEHQSALLELGHDIEQAYRNYLTKQNQKNAFETGMLQQALDVYNGKRYSYIRGATSFLEFLEAQRVLNATKQNYILTRFECLSALVRLQHVAGIWDIEF